jgi:cysteine-rich repeat protein
MCALFIGVSVLGLSCAKGNQLDTGGSGGGDEAANVASTGTTAGDSCGNGKVTGTETCDDGNTVAGDGCSAVCSTEVGFTCTGTPSVCTTICGDGVTVGKEGCDDGNQKPYDGCDGTCQIEPGWTCAGAPSVCTGTCGDGKLIGKEACDDGNTMAGDGCSPTCEIEPGFMCTGTPSACTTTCGDGIVAGTEGCDDHNTTPNDGCDGSCKVELGYMCTGSPSVCKTVCGDGILAGTEQCDDGNTNDADACTNSCTKGQLIVGGNFPAGVTQALTTLGETYLVATGSQWGTPNDVGVIIVSNDGGAAPYPDYTAHLNAGAHFLSIGGSADGVAGFTTWIGNYLTTDGTSSWHESTSCTSDWTRTNATGPAQFMPATFEFANPTSSYHMLHLATTQPTGTTIYGQTCDNPAASGLMASRRYASKGTFTMIGLDIGNYATTTSDPQAQTNFLVPFLKGYLLYVRSP